MSIKHLKEKGRHSIVKAKQSAKNTAQHGQAMIEYALILVLAIVALVAVLLITAPAVGNVFSNTVYNLLGQTTTPQDPMSAGEFWNLVTAVASYTPQAPPLVTNAPPPTQGSMSPVPSWTPTNVTPTLTPSDTHTPGPSPTPQDKEFDYPFSDDASNPDNFQDDFLDLFASAGPWDGEYWDANQSNSGDCNWGNDPFFALATGIPQRTAKRTNQVDKIDFPNSSLPADYWRTSDGRPYPGVETDFCTRFTASIHIPAGNYTLRYKKDDGIRVYIIGSTTERVLDSWSWTNGDWAAQNWTNTTAEVKTIRIIHRDTGGGSELRVRLYKTGQEGDEDCTWALSNERFKSASTAWSDSPGVPYQSNKTCVLRLRGFIDLSGAVDPYLEFYHAYELHNYDTISVGISVYESGIWNDVLLRTGSDTNFAFSRERFDLKALTGTQGTVDYRNRRIEMRFVLKTDANNNRDGWWIDDIRVQENVERVFYIGFGDDVEGDQFWVGDGTWARTSEKAHSGMSSWTDSPGGNYLSNSNTSLSLDGRLDLLHSNTERPEIVFWNSWDLNTGDSTYIELSTNRVTWEALRQGPTDSTDYLERATSEPLFVQTRVEIPESYWTLDRIYVRFRLSANNDAAVKSGWWIDDIEFRNKPYDSVMPTWCDDMEQGTAMWLPTGDWGQTTSTAKDGLRSWTDSPSGDYLHGSNSYLELVPYIDLSNPTLVRPTLEFWHRWDLNDTNSSQDKIYVEVSADDGNTWSSVWAYSATSDSARPPGFGNSIPSTDRAYHTNVAWTREMVELSPWLGVPASPTDYGLRLRFRLDARTGSRVGDGWYIDSVCLRRANNQTVTLPFADDLEVGPGNWIPSGGWTLSAEAAYSGGLAFTDSPGANYQHNTYHSLELRPTFNLNGTTKPTLYYWERYSLGREDRFSVQIREVDANGVPIGNWENIALSERYREFNLGWTRVAIDLQAYRNKYIRVRWHLDALLNTETDNGVWLDQVSIIDRTDEIQYTADPYYEDVETLAPGEWVFGHKWDTVSVYRSLGSGGSLGPGQWTVTWYDNITNICSNSATLATPRNTTTVDEINFDWGNGYPSGSGITDGERWGASFRRTFIFTQPTQYSFEGFLDDAMRIYDNGTLIYNRGWTDCGGYGEFTSDPYTFDAGTHNIEVRFYDNYGGARIELGFAGESKVFHDSPAGYYDHRTMTRVELEGQISLVGLENPVLFWEQRFDIGNGDNARVQISEDEGFSWYTVATNWNWSNWTWHEMFYDLTPYRGRNISIRLQLDARENSDVKDGWWVDNIRIIE